MEQQTFQRIGLAANLDKEQVLAILAEVIPDLLKCNFDLFVDTELVPHIDMPAGVSEGIPDDVDLIIAVGGDGTIIKWAREKLEQQTPILGLRGGRLGFLAEGRTEKVAYWLREGRYHVQERMRISADIVDKDDHVVTSFSALNEAVVHGTGFSRMVLLRVEVGGKLLREYAADGMIISTPTGSTAYSLSAGGPVLEPMVQAIVLTPLSPHTMNVRAIVVDADERIGVGIVDDRSDIMVTVDGQEGAHLDAGQSLRVARSALKTRLVVPDDYDFMALLREKL